MRAGHSLLSCRANTPVRLGPRHLSLLTERQPPRTGRVRAGLARLEPRSVPCLSGNPRFALETAHATAVFVMFDTAKPSCGGSSDEPIRSGSSHLTLFTSQE